MLYMFAVSHKTDGATQCRIIVEPVEHRCAVTISVSGFIVRMADETDASFRSVTNREWREVDFWERKAAALAKQYSPFWRDESAA